MQDVHLAPPQDLRQTEGCNDLSGLVQIQGYKLNIRREVREEFLSQHLRADQAQAEDLAIQPLQQRQDMFFSASSNCDVREKEHGDGALLHTSSADPAGAGSAT